jgi:uncharacterized protein YcaQ
MYDDFFSLDIFEESIDSEELFDESIQFFEEAADSLKEFKKIIKAAKKNGISKEDKTRCNEIIATIKEKDPKKAEKLAALLKKASGSSEKTESVDDFFDTILTESEIAEKPTAKPYDLMSITIPGGDSETPKSKPYDMTPIKVPASKEINDSAYNDAMVRLKKTFKEGFEMMDLMAHMTVVPEE